ncbi:F0F1 ATP synthase subunit B [Cryomorpha ignava]|uniref:ATP synthase subunit b n=1 Tax=Cryomorpha ignava TaxID=101383 RepID=A0A7K3WUG7_9FLAO|nr:F0F1 ATP synthase subunit B [Cryomorpha ignava]NEN24542.1 F0F1 ATP synthase subunit B [Cryomorpha ignava]
MLSVSIGTVVWSSIAFLIVLFLLAKLAWKPILASIREREDSIDDALKSASKAREEMANLTKSNEALLNEARAERDGMLKDARGTKDQIISEAKDRADVEYNKILASAKDAIRQEKSAAIAEIKEQVATLSIEIAERVIREELKSDEKQKQLIDKYLQEAKLN